MLGVDVGVAVGAVGAAVGDVGAAVGVVGANVGGVGAAVGAVGAAVTSTFSEHCDSEFRQFRPVPNRVISTV